MADLGVSDEYPVHLGFWTNWSHGRVHGATITLTHRNGALLTAFLALFVAFAGTSFWRIACFALHQFYSTDEAQDGLYHQRQAILRNAANGTTGASKFVRVLLAWRKRTPRPFRRLLPLIVFAGVCVAGFAVAGIFSSKISSAEGDEVLIASSLCGVPYYSTGDTTTAEKITTVYQPWDSKRTISSADYAQRCYSDNSQGDGCGPYVKKQLPSTIERNASCPFGGSICRSPDANVRLDSGYLNSETFLGVNAPSDLQFNLRVVTHCAPLVTEGHKQTYNYSEDKPYTQYFYGRRNLVTSLAPYNQTYEYEQLSARQFVSENFTSSFPDYSLGVVLASSYNGSLFAEQSTFIPINDLYQGDGDVALFFLSANDILYSNQVNDPWYAAHQSLGRPVHRGDYSGTLQLYLADEPAAVMGCKMQYQTCDPSLPTEQGCGKLGGVVDVDFSRVRPTDNRGRTMSWVLGNPKSVLEVVTNLKSSSLTSRYSLSQSAQAPLPDDQWQMDVENWHNIVLASLQRGVVDSAVGPEDAEMLQSFWRRPNNTEESYLCKNQKIISTAYTNFSVLGLSLILVLGFLIIALDYLLPSLIIFLEQHRHRHHGHGRTKYKYSRLEWFTSETLQLQRLAHEERGVGGAEWEGCAGIRAVPVTKGKGDLLATLDTADVDHPRLLKIPETAKREASSSEEDEDGLGLVKRENQAFNSKVTTNGNRPVEPNDENDGKEKETATSPVSPSTAQTSPTTATTTTTSAASPTSTAPWARHETDQHLTSPTETSTTTATGEERSPISPVSPIESQGPLPPSHAV